MTSRFYHHSLFVVGLAALVNVGCCRLQPVRTWPNLLAAPALPAAQTPPVIPPQGYLEKGYMESTNAPYTPPYYPPNNYMPPGGYTMPAQFTTPATPQYANATAPATPNTNPAQQLPPVVQQASSPEADHELRFRIEELHGKYNLVLDELAELRREVAANSAAISATSEQLDETGDGLKRVRTSLASWKKSLDGLEARVRDDRESQLSTLDEVESLLMSILNTEERTQK